jgi:hypothetical protein
MISRLSLFPAALLALGGTQMASAADYDEGQWVTTFMAGSGLIPNGSFNPAITMGATTLDHLQFRDAFDAGPHFGIEMGYMTQSNVEPFARLSYSRMQGRNATIGDIASPVLDSPVAIGSNFGDMDSWALNLGTRYFLTDNGPLRTYVAGYLGANRTDALHARFQVAGLPMSPSEEILPQETRFDAGVEGGLAWQVSNNADVSLSLGAQYIDARSEKTDAFAPLGIEAVRFSEPKWSVPIDLGVNFRF